MLLSQVIQKNIYPLIQSYSNDRLHCDKYFSYILEVTTILVLGNTVKKPVTSKVTFAIVALLPTSLSLRSPPSRSLRRKSFAPLWMQQKHFNSGGLPSSRVARSEDPLTLRTLPSFSHVLVAHFPIFFWTIRVDPHMPMKRVIRAWFSPGLLLISRGLPSLQSETNPAIFVQITRRSFSSFTRHLLTQV